MATIEEIKQRRDAITELTISPDLTNRGGFGWDVDKFESGVRGQFERKEDAEFIANAPEDIDALLFEIDRLNAFIDGLAKAIVHGEERMAAQDEDDDY